MKIITATNKRALNRLVDRAHSVDPTWQASIEAIVDDVRKRGDKAVRKYATRFDALRDTIEIPRGEILEGARSAPPAVRAAIKQAARHIRRVSAKQLPKKWRTSVLPGVVVEQRVTPLDRVGCYVPGGRYPLPSSLLMTALPAKVNGLPLNVTAPLRPIGITSKL